MAKRYDDMTIRELEAQLRERGPAQIRVWLQHGSWCAEATVERRSAHGLPRLSLQTYRAETLGGLVAAALAEVLAEVPS
jgi:hypothetical protein